MKLQLNSSSPIVLVSLGLLLAATQACADTHAPVAAPSAKPVAAPTTAPAAAPEHEAAEPVVTMPTTYRAAVDEIDSRVGNIARLIDEKKLANLHLEAAIIKKVAGGMSKLIAAEGSGVPATAYPEVLTAAKALSGLFGRVDEAGDSGNVEESRAAHAALAQQLVVLRKYAPVKQAAAAYACPMHPEVTSETAGRCPKCGMDLSKKAGE